MFCLKTCYAREMDEKKIPHGTASTYTNHRCRCDLCKASWAATVREYKQRRTREIAEGLREPKEHGTPYGYQWGCRCDDCTHAHSKYQSSIAGHSYTGRRNQKREGFCSLEGCTEPIYSSLMCRSHYNKHWYQKRKETLNG